MFTPTPSSQCRRHAGITGLCKVFLSRTSGQKKTGIEIFGVKKVYLTRSLAGTQRRESGQRLKHLPSSSSFPSDVAGDRVQTLALNVTSQMEKSKWDCVTFELQV